MRSLAFEPFIASAWWLLLAIAAAVAFARYAWTRPGAVSVKRWRVVNLLTGLAGAIVLIVLLNPIWIVPVVSSTAKPTLVIAIDGSASMATPDGDSGTTRYRTATTMAEALAARLGHRFDVSIRRDDGADLAGEPTGESTDLARAIRAGLSGDENDGRAIVLFSDGIHNDGPGARLGDICRLANALAVPVYAKTIGGDADVLDASIEWSSSQEIAYVRQKIQATAIVRQRGFAGRTATITLQSDGQVIDRRTVTFAANGSAECRFELAPSTPGIVRYFAEVEAFADDTARGNNRALLIVRTVDRPVRLLALEGKPYWDGKFLVRTLANDPSVELNSVVRIADGRFLRRAIAKPTDAAAPATTEEWSVQADATALFGDAKGLAEHQIVVLGRDADLFLTDAALVRLQEWVARDGGCLVCARGSPTSRINQRLGTLLPVRWTPKPESRFQWKWTARGRDLRIVPASAEGTDPLPGLPELAVDARPEASKPLTIVLATKANDDGESEPVVSYQPYGSGRVVVIEGAGMWRWAFLPPQAQQLDDVYRAFWQGMLRWLISSAEMLPGQTRSLRPEKLRFTPGESSAVTLILKTPPATLPAIELRGGDREPRTVTPVPYGDEPGTFRASFGPLPEGQYEARIAGTDGRDAGGSAAFEVRNASTERLDLRARPDVMARIARDSGGRSLDDIGTESLAATIESAWEARSSRQVERTPAWDRLWVLLTVFGLWTTAWMLRRSAGLT